MAFTVNFGTGEFGTVTNNIVAFNAYANVIAITSTTVTIGNTSTGAYDSFVKDTEVFFHVSAFASSDEFEQDVWSDYLGSWGAGKITGVNNNILTLDFNPRDVIPNNLFPVFYCQLITIPNFENIVLNTGTEIAPLGYNTEKHYGGILIFKCSDTLTFNGGHIRLTNCGIPAASKDLRPLNRQERQGTLDTDARSGWENAQTKDRFVLNAGDGAAFIIAKKIIGHADSRIGAPALKGVAYCRGATDSAGRPDNATNIGGSTILIAAGTFDNFSADMIAKYRQADNEAGQGLCRCYIASNSKLRNDEGLYAYDCISDPTRATTSLNVRDFGNGGMGNANTVTDLQNNYATVTAIDGAKVSYTNKTTNGFAPIARGALVMIHANHKNATNTAYSGRFFLARILHDDGTTLTLDALASNYFSNLTQVLENYSVQIVSIPQYNKFTLAATNSATPKFNGAQGGIFAISVEDTCDLRDGKINVEGKGGGSPYKREGLNQIGNAQNSNKLPIGEGHGSVLVLAKNLIMNDNTRIGATYSGAGFGGEGNSNGRRLNDGGGYKGSEASSDDFTAAYGGAGAKRGSLCGGYGSNGTNADITANGNAKGCQGAHIMIIADKITGFNQAAISTGGAGGSKGISANGIEGFDGGAGYGGGGGGIAGTGSATTIGYSGAYNGGGAGSTFSKGCGGSSGWAFIYCNQAVNQDTGNTVIY